MVKQVQLEHNTEFSCQIICNEKLIEKRGPGIHHVCFDVDDISNAIKELKEKNINILNDEPSIGAEGYKIVFIHPKSTGGVLVELAEKP